MQDDDKLLTQYARDGSQAAFGQLVARHLSLVYSTCLRELGSPPLAEDAAQVVFLLLARKARSLRAGPSLAGWLYKAARFVAKDVRKQEGRRRSGEERVMSEVTYRPEPFAPEWDRVEPLLNDALSALKAGEREAVLLRFIEGHTLAETGAALGLSEDAARMRVTRAVEKMRRHLTAHGVPVTGLVLTGFLTAEAAWPGPANAAAMTQATLQAISTGPTANVLLLSKGVYQTMKLIKMKLAALAAVVAMGGAALPPLAHAISPHNTISLPSAAPAQSIKPITVLPISAPTSSSSGASNTTNASDALIITVDFVDATSAEYKRANAGITSGLHHDALLLGALIRDGAKDVKIPDVQTGEGVQVTKHVTSSVPFTIMDKGQAQHNFMDLDSFVQATPRSNSDGTITVMLQVQRASLISNGPPPKSATATISKTVTFRDGQTLILGGRETTPTAPTFHLIFATVHRLKAPNHEVPAIPVPLTENVTTNFTLDKDQHAFYSATLPKGASMLILDMRRTGGKVGDLKCSLYITDKDAARLRGNSNATGGLEAMDDVESERRIVGRSVLKKPKSVLFDVRNQGGQCQYWFTILHAAPAVTASATEASPSASVPLFGAVVPTRMVVGETKIGSLAGNGNAYFLITLKAGRYQSFLNFSNVSGKSTELSGSLLLTDEVGFPSFHEAGSPPMPQTVFGADFQLPNSPYQENYKFTLQREDTFLVRIENQPDRVGHGTPVNFTARILPDSAASAEKQN